MASETSSEEQKPAALRQAEARDVLELRRIRHDSIVALAVDSYGPDGALEWANSASTDRELRAIQNHAVTVAEIEGSPVGWVERHDERILGLYVDPDHATKGIGRALMSHAEQQVRLAGLDSVTLHTSLNAEGFYLACGFEPTGDVASDEGLPMIKRFT